MMDIGGYSRILNKLKDAEDYLNKAMGLIDKYNLGLKLLVINRIGLAHVHQWKADYKTSEKMFMILSKYARIKRKFPLIFIFLFSILVNSTLI